MTNRSFIATTIVTAFMILIGVLAAFVIPI